ncbi:hypothetical protein LTR78_008280 [Recurvomyces mirabilis]|uniref:AHC1-like C2H2 zinc-finger domain-containing protein n=1 Tax=Recurvomyces mirabilis TaxID=574656 RepID=A0AAE0TTF8_9PEZI|nr:hypothetical protein LTR78_008280 [Recurvomyces mirabilis]KAK5156565.1 hypothetical protein LTS14_004777 [Recurvomyces mirabilis]
MHSVFRLPWCTDQIAPKMQTGKAALDLMRASPVLDLTALNKAKRKRAEDAEVQRVETTKRQCGGGEAFRQSPSIDLPARSMEGKPVVTPSAVNTSLLQIAQISASNGASPAPSLELKAEVSKISSASAVQPSSAADNKIAQAMSSDVEMKDAIGCSELSPLQQVIENEFNMQILMKHNELRLIEQELAKCQIGLEQLRRIELRPYPGAEKFSSDVSAGIGASLAPPARHSRPMHAAPHGVADGPYSRHYRRWLLHDTTFDSIPLQATFVNSAPHIDSRPIRHASTSRKSVQKSPAAPAPVTEMPKSLPNYPASTRKIKLAVVRRSTDGLLVKLVCNHCHRSDFSNSQGFLNHCRIGHKLEYKSHDHAAIDCGHPLEEHEYAAIPPEVQNTPVAKPSSHSRAASTNVTPLKASGLVHPLNTSGGLASLNTSSPQPLLKKAIPRAHPISGMSGIKAQPQFTASAQAPRLSAQFAKHNFGGDLQAAIASAKERVDLGAEAELSPDILDSASPRASGAVGGKGVFGVPRAGSLAPPNGAGPPSRKGYRQPTQHSRPSPLVPVANIGLAQSRRNSHHEMPDSPDDRSLNLSPHTIDSEPGLVSDHEDDDQGSASEDEVPHTTISHPLNVGGRTCADNMDIDVSVDDTIDEHGVIIRRNSLLASENHGLGMANGVARK